MRKIIIFLILAGLISACKKNKNQDSSETITDVNKGQKERDINDFLVLKSPLMANDLDGAEYENVKFTNEGALFFGTEKTPSFIKLPLVDLDLSKEFNISFSFITKTDDGSKPQTFLAFTDDYSSPVRSIPLFIYSAGKRITGVYGDQKLWAENYDKSLGESKTYYDSFPLPANEIFHVSINFIGTRFEVFVNSELYASFDNIEPHTNKYDYITLGALPTRDGYTLNLNGALHGLKIFNIALTKKEMVSVYNNQPYIQTEE